MYDLPSEDPEEPGLPDEFHIYQPQLLRETFQPPQWQPDLVFSATDLNLYYDLSHPNWYKRPDWFGIVGVSRLYEGRDLRLSYVIWQEQVSPFVVVELLSPGTEAEDLGETVRSSGNPPTKWQVYERILRVPYYIVFSRYTDQLQIFRLIGGHYEVVEVTEVGLAIPELELTLGLWRGNYQNIDRLWLRWLTTEGNLILTPSEQALAAQQQATEVEQQLAVAQQQAREAEQRAERLAARLRELGVEPDQLV
jgi:Uma2 family endonuclease